MDVQVFHRNRENSTSHPCLVNNGGCSHLCLTHPHPHRPRQLEASCACPTGHVLMVDGQTCNPEINAYLIFPTISDIRTISFDVNYFADIVLPITKVSKTSSVDVDLNQNELFWTNGLDSTIYHTPMSGGSPRALVNTSVIAPASIAIDWIGGNIYWADGGTQRIEVSKLDGSSRRVLFSKNLTSPSAVIVDFHSRSMFWTDIGDMEQGQPAKIERAAMDGTGRKVIVSTNLGLPRAITVDNPNGLGGRIYWTDSFLKIIESTTLEGKDRRNLLSGLYSPYGVAVFGDYLYWTDFGMRTVNRINKNDQSNQVVIAEGFDGLGEIRVVKRTDLVNKASFDHPCDSDRGCSHLCLPNNSVQKYSCSCPTGIIPAGTECPKFPSVYLLFAARSTVRRISMDTGNYEDVILVSGLSNAIGLDYLLTGPDEGIIFWTDIIAKSIFAVDLDGTNMRTIVTPVGLPDWLAVDWISKNIYWSDDESNSIEVARTDGSNRRVIANTNLDHPRGIAVHPHRGLMFWTDWGLNKIERANMDGSKRQVFVDTDIVWPNGITIDYDDNRVYWVDASTQKLESISFNGNDRRLIVSNQHRNIQHPFGVAVYSGFVFWSDWRNRSIFRAHVRTVGGTNQQRITNVYLPMQLQIVSSSNPRPGELGPTPDISPGPCMFNNGGCEHLCLPINTTHRNCACPDDLQNADPVTEVCVDRIGTPPAIVGPTDEPPSNTTDRVTCTSGGQQYDPGDTFPAGDGCNTCTCGDDGTVACSEIGCLSCAVILCAPGFICQEFGSQGYCDPTCDMPFQHCGNEQRCILVNGSCDVTIRPCPHEVRCEDINCTEGSVRLVNGSTPHEGLLEVCSNGTWGAVCLFGFSSRDAAVICRQLGLPVSGAQASRVSTTGAVVVDEVRCNGTEARLNQCTLRASGRFLSCSRFEVAGVICGNASNCTDGDVRIVQNPFSSSSRGPVEICFGGEWGRVCDDSRSWDREELAVMCRQLGFRGFSGGRRCCSSPFDGFVPGFLNNITCNGTESRLTECSSSGLGVKVCGPTIVEAECSDPPPCLPSEFECPFGHYSDPCISERRVCDTYEHCIGGSDEQNCPDIVTIGFALLEYSVYEGRHSKLKFCLQAVNGSFDRPVNVTIENDNDTGTANPGIDYRSFKTNVTFGPGQHISCYIMNSSDLTIDDTLLEFTEYFRVIVFPPDANDRFVRVDPNFRYATVFITDNEIAQVGFDSAVYLVSEGDGEVMVSVRQFGNGVELGQPIAIRVSISDEGNATAGTDYQDQGVLPQIAYLEAHSPPSQMWDISIPIVDDSDIEGPEAFTLSIFLSNVGVIVVQDTTTVIIADRDDSGPVDLEVYFTGDTPRFEGNTQINTVTFQMDTNKPASVRCREPSKGNIACSPGEVSVIANLTSGTYTLRVIARAGSERDLAAITFVIPENDETCTVHLINRGVTVHGDTATVEFGGFMSGRVTGYSCQLDSQPSMPCTSPLILNGLSVGRHQLQVSPQGCEANRPLTETFTV